MKILHTADWHIGQTFFGYDRAEEHTAFLDWLHRQLISRRIDALLICGDVFDVANPSAAAQKQFYRFIRRAVTALPQLQIVVIAGNHDSASRLETPLPLLEEMNTHIKGIVGRDETDQINPDDMIVELTGGQTPEKVWCMAVPYLRQGDYPVAEGEETDYPGGVKAMYDMIFRRVCQRKGENEAVIAMGHLQAAGSSLSEDDSSERLIIGGLEGIPADTFNPAITYTALGHIHREQKVGRRDNVRYSGSPLAMSFAEENYHHGVILLETEGSRLVSQEKLDFAPPVKLIRIPSRPLPLPEVLAQLALLPAKDPLLPAPYLEIRVGLSEPEPTLRTRIEEAIAEKHVRLTRVLPFYPEGNGTATENETAATTLLTDPLGMFRKVYDRRFHADVPLALEELFLQAMHESYQKQGEKS